MSDINKKNILSLKALTPKSYQNFDLDRLAIYALHTLEEKKIPLYFDYASVALFKLFPKKFSMANFVQYPDTNRISKALRRLADQKRKGWVTGAIENGFNLTALGREMALQTSKAIANPELHKAKPPVATKSRGKSASQEIVEIRESDTFQKWKMNAVINNHEFFAFLKAAPYAPKELLVEHLNQLKTSSVAAGDKEVSDFLVWFETKFHNLLH